ncbi:MAG TPA: 6-phospho-3-hexuloisomerase [Candidatus Andersenbacteria bacterium]|nr:6-phospho-3-hexuloisomerase [Candidatus Andersenbacteria bacterium]
MNTASPQVSETLHIQTASFQILAEISWVLGKVSQSEVEDFLREIAHADVIVACGAGRVGMAVRGFAMRLGHLGKNAHMLGDATVPSIGKGDLLIVASGSGETQTIFDIVAIAHKNGARVALVTGNIESKMGKLAHAVVHLPAPSKTKQVEGFTSSQPMTTLNEQCLGILFDAMVLMLMGQMKETHDTMWARHSNLE